MDLEPEERQPLLDRAIPMINETREMIHKMNGTTESESEQQESGMIETRELFARFIRSVPRFRHLFTDPNSNEIRQ